MGVLSVLLLITAATCSISHAFRVRMASVFKLDHHHHASVRLERFRQLQYLVEAERLAVSVHFKLSSRVKVFVL